MAKQLGVIQFHGKLGQIVGVKKSSGQKSNTIRVLPGTVRNPKSNGQVSRRMRITPAVNFYRALQDILNHSWQGVPYGGASYSEFMKYALRNEAFPFLIKGDNRPVAAPYQISKGSVASIVPFYWFENIALLRDSETVGIHNRLTQDLGLSDGDQLTFIQCFVSDDTVEDCQFIWQWTRIFVGDSDSENRLNTVDGGGVGFAVTPPAAFPRLFAYAVIISRPHVSQSSGLVRWERSNASIIVTTTAEIPGVSYADFIANGQKQAALDSYKNSAALGESDWYLNGGSTSGGSSAERVTITVSKDLDLDGIQVTGGGTYDVGETVTLSATGYQYPVSFLGWYEGDTRLSVAATYMFTAERSVSIVAKFENGDMP